MSQRISGVSVGDVEPRIAAVLNAQKNKWGGPLLNHLVYARLPDLFKAVRAMWAGVDAPGLIDAKLIALVNRRVAMINKCEF